MDNVTTEFNFVEISTEYMALTTTTEDIDAENIDAEEKAIYRFERIKTVEKDPYTFYLGFSVVTILLTALMLYLILRSAFPKDVFKRLSLQHILTAYLHIFCVTFYNPSITILPTCSETEQPFNSNLMLSYILAETSSRLDLVLVYVTSTIAWIIFLRLFLFKDGEELYEMKWLMFFSAIVIFIIECYEGLMMVINCDELLISTLRLTSLLLIMCVSVSVYCLTLICFVTTLTSLSLPQTLFSLWHMLLLFSSDILLLRFNLESDSQLVWLWNLLLYVRLAVEIIWYFIHDRLLYHFAF